MGNCCYFCTRNSVCAIFDMLIQLHLPDGGAGDIFVFSYHAFMRVHLLIIKKTIYHYEYNNYFYISY